MSKIQFESKSQPGARGGGRAKWWISVCQRYNLKANHNKSKKQLIEKPGEYQYVKDTIWKQITTIPSLATNLQRVNISMSKIQFESKSQLVERVETNTIRWISVCQRYNLKANHNRWVNGATVAAGEYQYVKDTIWKQITTSCIEGQIPRKVNIRMSKIQFESKSQLDNILTLQIVMWISVCQRYNLKANHNCQKCFFTCFKGEYQYVKDTIWKQITTLTMNWWKNTLVNISMSKIQFESKSQLAWGGWTLCWRWISVCQRYNLKANHNLDPKAPLKLNGEYQYVKDTIWKQITTGGTLGTQSDTVNISMSKIQFESKSQQII